MTTKQQMREKEACFVREYLVDRNATQAAIRSGYSPRSAGKTAHDMLQKPHIQAALTQELKAQETRTLITADANLRAIERLAERAETAGEFSAAIRARELIGKHYKSFTDRLEVKDTTPRAERLRAARERLKQLADE